MISLRVKVQLYLTKGTWYTPRNHQYDMTLFNNVAHYYWM